MCRFPVGCMPEKTRVFMVGKSGVMFTPLGQADVVSSVAVELAFWSCLGLADLLCWRCVVSASSFVNRS